MTSSADASVSMATAQDVPDQTKSTEWRASPLYLSDAFRTNPISLHKHTVYAKWSAARDFIVKLMIVIARKRASVSRVHEQISHHLEKTEGKK